jgi:hypothetical protein
MRIKGCLSKCCLAWLQTELHYIAIVHGETGELEPFELRRIIIGPK